MQNIESWNTLCVVNVIIINYFSYEDISVSIVLCIHLTEIKFYL